MSDLLSFLIKPVRVAVTIALPICVLQSIHSKRLSPIIAKEERAITVFGKPYDLRHYDSVNGVFTLTAYNLDRQSTGKTPGDPGYGVTASGTSAATGRTVAVDPHVIPYGALLYIDGIGWRIAEDTGGAIHGKHIDVLVDNRRDAIQFGVVRHRMVEIFTASSPALNVPIRYHLTASGNPRFEP